MRLKTVSGLKKVFLDEDIVEKKQLLRGSCLKNECYHYEVLFDVEEVVEYRIPALLKVVSPIKSQTLFSVLRLEPIFRSKLISYT